VSSLFRSVGLVARFDTKNATKLAEDLAKHLTTTGLEVFIEETLAAKINTTASTVPLERMKTDFVITIGGDGTILRTCISIPKPEPPILTINMGVRGFLAEVEPKQAFAAVDKCLKGDFKIEKCMKLSAQTERTKLPEALNEVVISADEPAKLLYARILKDGAHIIDCQSDGLMVATQTGSTGYSLSAGGPVLDLGVNAFVLTPICPLNIFRPIVFPADSSLTIKVERPKEILVLIDGHHREIVNSKRPSITITRSKHETSFIRLREDFYHRLKGRLLFKGMRWKP
jgi:NAD+ kinase